MLDMTNLVVFSRQVGAFLVNELDLDVHQPVTHHCDVTAHVCR